MNKSKLPPVRPEEILNRINITMNIQSADLGQLSRSTIDTGEMFSLPRFSEAVKLPQKDRYELHELMCFHDEQFIRAAYYAILRRSPDESGLLNFLTPLRSGSMTRAEILARLQGSDEAKRYNVRIDGIKSTMWSRKLARLPFIGYIFRWLSAVVKLPMMVHRLQEFEAFTNARFSKNEYQTDILTGRIEDALLYSYEKVKKCDDQRAIAEKGLNKYQEISERVEMLWTQHKDNDASLFTALYVEFENQFRGSREDIKSRQSVYLPYMTELYKRIPQSKIVDLGCGRGEWLELLTEQGFTAEGADLNPHMVYESQRLDLKITESDAITFLKNQEASSFGAITGFHIIEHIPLNILVTLFEECIRVLKPGGVVIFETPNPENLLVGSYSFHFDPTHVKPLVPDVVQFIAQQKGFVNTEILRLHKRNEPDYIKHRDIDEALYKISMEQDYSIIGYKPKGD